MKTFSLRTPQGTGTYNPIDEGGQPVEMIAAVPNQVAALQPAVAAGSPVGFSTGNIARKGSGLVEVTATISGAASGAATLTATMLRDGAALAGSPTAVASVAAGDLDAAITLTWIDTLPDDANHTYGIQVAASAGTFTLTAAQGSVTAIEL